MLGGSVGLCAAAPPGWASLSLARRLGTAELKGSMPMPYIAGCICVTVPRISAHGNFLHPMDSTNMHAVLQTPSPVHLTYMDRDLDLRQLLGRVDFRGIELHKSLLASLVARPRAWNRNHHMVQWVARVQPRDRSRVEVACNFAWNWRQDRFSDPESSTVRLAGSNGTQDRIDNCTT